MNRTLDAFGRFILAGFPIVVLTILCLGVVRETSAAVVSNVTVYQVSSELDPYNSSYPWDEKALYVINGSGLDNAGRHGNNSFGTMWSANTYAPSQTNGPTDTAPFITFDLGAAYSLTSLNIWNYNGIDSVYNYSGRSIKNVDVSISLDGSQFSNAGTYNLDPALGASLYSGQMVPFDFDARYVRFDIRTNHAGDLAYGVGLSEVQFVTAVPNPPTIILLGTALVSLIGFRRKKIGRHADVE
jgi:hypothetical protein